MDRKNRELRATLRKLWPIQTKKKNMLQLLVPSDEGMYSSLTTQVGHVNIGIIFPYIRKSQ